MLNYFIETYNLLFALALILFLIYAGIFTPVRNLGFFAATDLLVVEAVFLTILSSIRRTRFILTEKEVVIKTTRLIGETRWFH